MSQGFGRDKPAATMNRHERRAAAAIARHADHNSRKEGAQKAEMLEKAQRMVSTKQKANKAHKKAELRRMNERAAVEGVGQVHMERRKNRYAPDEGKPSNSEFAGQF